MLSKFTCQALVVECFEIFGTSILVSCGVLFYFIFDLSDIHLEVLIELLPNIHCYASYKPKDKLKVLNHYSFFHSLENIPQTYVESCDIA